jgi:hypothetical protein
MTAWLVSWLGDAFGDSVLEPIGEFIRGIFEGLLTFLFGWIV